MKTALRNFGVGLFGLGAAVLTAIVVTSISRILRFDIFTFSVWLIVPVGALFTGAVAASGYYLGSLVFHKRAGIGLLVQMIVIAATTQWLIYYMGYMTLLLDDGSRVSEIVPFGRYLGVLLTSSHYQMGRTMIDVGEVGAWGYFLAIDQLMGFLAGGVFVFLMLRKKRVCEKCNMYYRSLANKVKTFEDGKSASAYYDNLFKDSDEFANLIGKEANAKPKSGAVMIRTVLRGCPNCKRQLIDEMVQIYDGNRHEWRDLSELDRAVLVPDGIDLIRIFRSETYSQP